MQISVYFHPVDNSNLFFPVEIHAVSIAAVYLENIGINGITGFLDCAEAARFGIVQGYKTDAILLEKAVGLALQFILKELVLKEFFIRHDFQVAFRFQLELLSDFDDSVFFQIDELQEIIEFQGRCVIFGCLNVAIPAN